MTTKIKTQKIVQVIARYQLKRNGHVVYSVRPSKGGDPYTTTLVNGKATGCTCPATKPCYHMTQLEAKEAARTAKPVVEYVEAGEHKVVSLVSGKLETTIVEPVKLSREAYCALYAPCMIA